MAQDILIVDDEHDIAQLVSDILGDEGFTTRCAYSGEQALEEVRRSHPKLVLLDIWLGESRLDGLMVLEIIKSEIPDLPVIMMSGHGTIETAVSAIKKGAYDFLEKPFQAEKLLVILQRALETAQLKRENKQLLSQARQDSLFLGESSVVCNLREIIDKVAPTNSRVFITGACGAGKETVARQIHEQSNRAEHPFVVLNCANIEEGIEKILFGCQHEKGYEPGLLEQAHMGTLYLDEVCDLSLETQGKIVKALQSNVVERIDGTAPIEIDVRIISSTSHNIQQLIEDRKFREDLYYRLNVVPITVSKLKSRVEDIPLLAQHFLDVACDRMGQCRRKLGDDTILAMQSYDWPGNLRQLKNVMEWVVIMSEANDNDNDNIVKACHLPPEILDQTPSILRGDLVGEFLLLPLREARERFERDYLVTQVARFSGNVSQTANFVGMERSALHRKLKNLAIERLNKAI